MLNNTWIVTAFLCCVQLSMFVFVAPAESQDFLATGCSADEIQSAIDSCLSTGGGTVTIPACEAFGTWQTGDNIKATIHAGTELRVLGQGPDKTKIGYASGQHRGRMFWFRGPGLKEFGELSARGDGYSGGAGRSFLVMHAPENTRVHHIITDEFAGPTGAVCATKNVVIDHCTFGTVLYGGTYQWYVYSDNSYSTDWTQNYGTTNYNIFFEDVVFKESHHPVSLFAGGSAVIRHCTLSFELSSSAYSNVIDTHSPFFGCCASDDEPYNWDPDISRGGRAYEIYNNTMIFSGAKGKANFARIRAGSVLFTGNDVSVTHPEGELNQPIQLVCERNNNGPRCTSEYGFPVDYTFSNRCEGEDDGCCDKVETSYIWDNTLSGNIKRNISTYQVCGDGSLVEEKDYFLRAPTMAEDGFEWTPYQYPHPLVAGGAVGELSQAIRILEVITGVNVDTGFVEDIDGDGKTGLAEAVHILKSLSL